MRVFYMKPNHNSYLIYRCSSAYNDKQKCENYGVKCAYILSSVWTCVKETLHTEEYGRFNTQRANELQGINKADSGNNHPKSQYSVDELKTQSASLIAKIKKLNNDDLINELETDYNVLCKQIKQTEQEISELNGQIAENDAEIKRNVEQKRF